MLGLFRREELHQRIREAEEIIRAHKRLEWAMYNSSLEISWPTDAHQLSKDYENRYDVDFDEGVYD